VHEDNQIMSQIQVLHASMIRKAAAITNKAFISLPPHPALSVKFIPNAFSCCHHRFYVHGGVTSRAEVISKNVSRLYARRVLELAAMSAATMAATTRMEANIDKPAEWSTVDLALQRKEFGESISSLGKTRVERVWAAGSRIFNLALLASPLTILAPVAYFSNPESKAKNIAWDYAVWSVEKAGPTFIKLIQWATTRNDLFSTEFIKHFSELQDNTRGHTWNDTVSQLNNSLQSNYEDLFDFDDSTTQIAKEKSRRRDKYTPIGSGCVAQVYKAKLKQPIAMMPAGADVAIKVTHPHILHKVCVDFYILNKITAFLEKIPFMNLDYLSMKDSVEQFRDIMLPQLDLRVEARNLKRFRRDFADNSKVTFPSPLDELTTQNVLVETFIHGTPIIEYAKGQHGSEADREELAKIGLQTVMQMIFLNDFVHGDLHPGNILVNRNMSARDKPLKMNIIDCGLVVEMGENEHVNLVKILGSFIKKDGVLAGELMIDHAKKCQSSALDKELFCKGIQEICDDDTENNFLESVGDYISDICYLACNHKVKLEASFINAALACEIMEGLACKLYPKMEVQQFALPVVFKAEVMHGLKTLF